MRLWAGKDPEAKKATVDGTIISLWCTKDKPLVSRNCNGRVKAIIDNLESIQFGSELKFIPIYDNTGNGKGKIVCNKVVVVNVFEKSEEFDLVKAPQAFVDYFTKTGAGAAWKKTIEELVNQKRAKSSF